MLSLGVLIIIGIGVVGGVVGGVLFKKMKIPQVVGYICTGLLIGNSGLNIVTLADVNSLKTFNMFALGVIGFLVGAEIQFSTFKKYSKQFSFILLGEGLFAFLLTGFATGLLLFFAINSLPIAIAGGIVLGAIASATDPASTISVLKEYKTAGIFTTTLIVIIALDDALAMALYGLGTGISQIISGSGNASLVLNEMLKVLIELGGSIGLGVLTGFVLTQIFRKSSNYDNSISAASGILLFVVGLGIYLNLDIILITMSAAVLFVNINPARSKKIVDHIRSISSPIYIFFFVLIGARISFSNMPLWVWGIVGLYVAARSLGKYFGAGIGARLSNSPEVVKKYVGLGLFSQGGVAIGLSIMAAHHLENIYVVDNMSLGDLIITVVAMTTFIVQIIGPAAVKLAAKRSKETMKVITEEDLINKYYLNDFIIHDTLPSLRENSTAQEIVTFFSQGDFETIPVTKSSGEMIGTIELDNIRSTLAEPNVWQWIIAADLMSDKFHFLNNNITLNEAFQLANQLQIKQLPVCSEDLKYVGYFDQRKALKRIRAEIISNSGEA